MTEPATCHPERPVYVKKTGECRRCYERRYYAEKVKPTKPVVPRAYERLEPVSYWVAHSRVRDARGSASAHICTACQKVQASQWAYVHGDEHEQSDWVSMPKRSDAAFLYWSSNVWAYTPMCVRCHRRYDFEAAVEREVQRRLKEIEHA